LSSGTKLTNWLFAATAPWVGRYCWETVIVLER